MLAIFACIGLRAQTFSLVSGRETVASLDGLWHFHTGDNPAWADPNFDDSHWPLIRSDESWTKQGYPAFNGYGWYRFKIEVPGDGRPLDLLLTEIANGYQVYADGKLIGSAGSSVPTGDPLFVGRRTIFPLPAVTGEKRAVQIALRVWTYLTTAYWAGAGTWIKGSKAGDPALLLSRLRGYESDRTIRYVNEYAYGLIAGLIGVAILALFLLHPADKEYLWFSILLPAESAGAALHLALNLGSLPLPLWDVLRLIAKAASVLAAMAFFSIVLSRPRSFLWWIIRFLVAASPLTAALIYFQWTGMGISYAIAGLCILPAYLWIIGRLVVGTFRRDPSARLLILPVALSYVMYSVQIAAYVTAQLTGSSKLPATDLDLVKRPFEISLGTTIDLVFFLAVLIFLMLRFSLARKKEERLATEFEAAKTVQSLLIPALPPPTPGFAVENVYLPAQEVGVDFFQILPGSDGSLRIVLGDVSGKGLKAAMTVSAIVGALRGCTMQSPAQILAYLNQTLHGQITGFFTCSTALISAEGKLTIANAGHLPPYLNGEELPVDSGLPLGISNETVYAEKTWTLAPNDRLTFVSDGVVEARNASGELYGFVRTKSIGAQPADAIARTAQSFGQEDDITVLTVVRAPKLQEVPA